MSENNPVLVRSDLEKNLVVRPAERSVLGSYDVEVSDLTPESAKNPAVEFSSANRRNTELTSAAGEEALT